MLLKKEEIMLVLLPASSSSRFFRSHDDRRDNSMLIPLHPCRKKIKSLKIFCVFFFLAFEAENAANEVEEEIIRMSVRSFSSIRKSIKSSFIKVTATL